MYTTWLTLQACSRGWQIFDLKNADFTLFNWVVIDGVVVKDLMFEDKDLGLRDKDKDLWSENKDKDL